MSKNVAMKCKPHIFTSVNIKRGTIVACYHPLPLSACMLHFDLVSIYTFWHFNPYILEHCSGNVFTLAVPPEEVDT